MIKTPFLRQQGNFRTTFNFAHCHADDSSENPVYGAIDPVPDLYPPRTRDLALHRPGLTPADEANSAGVMNPRDV